MIPPVPATTSPAFGFIVRCHSIALGTIFQDFATILAQFTLETNAAEIGIPVYPVYLSSLAVSVPVNPV